MLLLKILLVLILFFVIGLIFISIANYFTVYELWIKYDGQWQYRGTYPDYEAIEDAFNYINDFETIDDYKFKPKCNFNDFKNKRL